MFLRRNKKKKKNIFFIGKSASVFIAMLYSGNIEWRPFKNFVTAQVDCVIITSNKVSFYVTKIN